MSEQAIPPEQSSNGRSRTDAASVRSGLAHRRNPVLATLGDFAVGARKAIFRDPLSLFLAVASIGLAIAFAVLLGDIKPGSAGTQVPISTVQALSGSREISNAVLLDHDSRVMVVTTPGATLSATTSRVPRQLWAAYPASIEEACDRAGAYSYPARGRQPAGVLRR